MDNKLRISITGASGLLGTFMAEMFGKEGHIIKCHRNTSKIPVELSQYDFEWVQGDIRDHSIISELIENCDLIIHCAAMVSFDKRDFQKMMSINVEGTRVLVDNLIGKQTKLIHISSIAALGRVDNGSIIDENVLFNSEIKSTAYAQSKYQSELEVHRGIAEGIRAMILSPSVILGNNKRSTSSATIWNQIMKFPKFAPKGANGFVDVKDVVQAAKACLKNWSTGEKYIVNGHNLPYIDLYNLVLKQKGISKTSSKISPKVLLLILPLAKLFFFLTRTASKISKEAIISTSKSYKYDNSKSIKELGVNYVKIEESVRAYVN